MSLSATDEQLEAINSLDNNCIVTAGAGSGKTFVLVERYLKIIEEFTNIKSNIIDEIVAITFTEKAAKEMKDRIRKEMYIRKKQALSDNLSDKVGMWTENIEKLEYANISTFHSFCTKILKEYPVEFELDSEFNVLDSTESKWILTEIISKELKKSLEQAKLKEYSPLYQWVKNAGFNKTVSQLQNVYYQVINSGIDYKDIRQFSSKSFEQSPYKLITDWGKLIALGDELYYGEGNYERLKIFREKWTLIKGQLLLSKDNGKDLETYLDLLKNLTSGNLGSTVKLERKKFSEHLKILIEYVEAIKYHEKEKEFLGEFYILIERIYQKYKEEKEKHNALDFDDMQTKVIDLLKRDKDIRNQIHRRISFLMIDEFQDSNQVQKELIELILEDESKNIKQGALFIVGDPKQSIYRFRGADVTVFKDMERKLYNSSGKSISMQKNFRSVPEIINFLNFFFKQIMSDDINSPNYYENAIPTDNYKNEGSIEFIPIYSDADEEQNIREQEAELIATRIRNLLLEGVQPKDIALLFRSMSNIKTYEHELIKNSLSYYVVGGRGFFQKQEVFDLINVLEYLLNNSNRIAMAGILRSPMVALSDDTIYKIMTRDIWGCPYKDWVNRITDINKHEKNKLQHFNIWITSIKRITGRVKVSELIEKIVEVTNYKAILLAQPNGMQAVANIEKLIRLADKSFGDNPYSILDFLQKINRLINDEQQETEAAIESEAGDTIKLMTIHQSKGLQFPYVFVPDLSRKPINDDSIIKFSSLSGLTCKLPDENDWVSPIRWLKVLNEDKRLEQEESARILYVAMTRVKRKLLLSGKVEVTNGKYEKNNILKANSWSKWFDIIMQYDSINLYNKTWNYSFDNQSAGIVNIYIKEHTETDVIDNELDYSNNILKIIEKEEAILPNNIDILEITNTLDCQKDKVYSISAIKRYLNCPRYYYFVDILALSDFQKWLINEEVEDYKSDISPALKGVIVHQLLEKYTDNPSEIGNWESDYYALLKETNLTEYEITSNFKEEVSLYISNFKNSVFFRTHSNVKSEYEFFLKLENGIIFGIIDRLEIDDNKFSIIDYKTDKLIDKDIYAPQIKTYALAIKKNFNLEPLLGLIYYIRYNAIEEIAIDSSSLQAWEKELNTIIIKLNMLGKFEEFNPNKDNCEICGFKLLCNRQENK